jgi:hypothetical protein
MEMNAARTAGAKRQNKGTKKEVLKKKKKTKKKKSRKMKEKTRGAGADKKYETKKE